MTLGSAGPVIQHPGAADPVNPARVYHDSAAGGSRPAIRATLGRIGGWLLGLERRATWEECCALKWWELRARHVAMVRRRLAECAAPATVNRDLSILRGVITVAWENELMETDSYTRAVHIHGVDKDSVKAGRALKLEELRRLVEATETWRGEAPREGMRAAAMLALMYGAGLRRAEIANILVENVEKDGSKLLLVGKRNKRRVAYVAPGWTFLVKGWIEIRGSAPGLLFGIRAPETVGRVLAELRGRAGVAKFTPHDLRRSFGTHLLAAGHDLSVVRDLLGHGDVKTTILYDRRGDEEMAEAVKDLPGPEGS